MPTARYFHSSCVLNGKIYVIGGVTAENRSDMRGSDRVEVYDPLTATWSEKKAMPTARESLAISALNGKIYAIGGAPQIFKTELSVVEEYDPQSDSWNTSKTGMPTARIGFSTSVVNGKIYAIGGKKRSTNTVLADVEAYDPKTNTWLKKAPMHHPRVRFSTCVVDGKIYAFGGGQNGGKTVEVYDPLKDEWTLKADMPNQLAAYSISAINGLIYIFGGTHVNGGPPVSLSWIYNPKNDTWKLVSPLPLASQAGSACTLGGKIYITGGSAMFWPFKPLSSVFEYNPDKDPSLSEAKSGSHAERDDLTSDRPDSPASVKGFNIEAKGLIPEKGPTPQNVRQIAQDSNGFIWLGTTSGLLKYDGYTITSYQHDSDNPGSLSDNHVTALIVSHTGDLWIGTHNGLNRLQPDINKFTVYHSEPGNLNSLDHDWIQTVFEDKSGLIWIGTQHGLDQFNPKTGTFTRYDNLIIDGAFAITEEPSGVLWFGGVYGLVRYDRENQQCTHYLCDPHDLLYADNNFVRSLRVDKDGLLWIGTNSAILHLKKDDSGNFTFTWDTPKKEALSPDIVVRSIFEDMQGVLWFATDNEGLYRYDKNNDLKPVICQINPLLARHQNIRIHSVFDDNAGIMWMAADKSAYKIDKRSLLISSYTTDNNGKKSMSSNWITSMVEDDKAILWIATHDGLNRFDRKNNNWKRFYNEPGNVNSLSFNQTTSMAIDTSGYIWIGTFEGGLNRFNPEKSKWKRYEEWGKPGLISYNWIPALYITEDNTLWAGTWFGILNRYERQSDSFTWFSHLPGDTNTLGKSESILSILQDKSGILWIGTDGGGLDRFDPIGNRFTHYKNQPGKSGSLSNNVINLLYEDHDRILWIGSMNGLNSLDLKETNNYKKKQTIKRYLAGEVISGILEDNNGNIWISSKGLGYGLHVYNPQTESFTDFGYLFGQPSKLLYKSAASGEFYISKDGLHSFDPTLLTKNLIKPEVVLTDFQILNKSVGISDPAHKENNKGKDNIYLLEKSITATKEITLSYDQKIFAFEFSAMHYSDPSKNQYAYKMEGFDKDWNYIGNRRYVSFSNLPAGEYNFRVKASNSEGIWNEEGISLAITITPPWWETRLAYIFYFVFFITLLAGLWRFRSNRLKMKQQLEMQYFEAEKLREVDQLKSRFFANISHEFRTPLTLILGPLQKMLTDYKGNGIHEDLNIMQRNALRLRQLIDQLLDLSKIEAQGMSLQAHPADLVQKVREWAASFTSLAESRNITLRLLFPDGPVIVYFDAEKMEKIIYNLLGNAFKFTPQGGEVKVMISKEPTPDPSREGDKFLPLLGGEKGVGKNSSKHIKISISNSGPGIAAEHMDRIFDRFYSTNESLGGEQGSSGIGLALVKELVELHHGRISVESTPAKGTTFSIFLPFGRDHLKDEEIDNVFSSPQKQETDHLLAGLSHTESDRLAKNKDIDKNKPLVLIVEDNQDMRRFISECLAPDYDIEEAEHGKAGIETALKIIPDLIISDVMMPEMDGFEFCARIKTDERTSHVPLILMTARAAQEDKISGLEIGADAYIVKPFDREELKIRVKKLIEQRRRLREHFQREIFFGNNPSPPGNRDEKFIQKAITAVQAQMSNPDFGTPQLVRALDMGRVQLHRKLQALTGLSASAFIRTYRLKQAAELLRKNSANVSEIAYDVGFNNLSYFHRCFLKQFGKTPAQYNQHPE